MNQALAEWNALPAAAAVATVLSCCGSAAWAKTLTRGRPFPDESSLLFAADEVWRALTPADWHEAFRSHPRIGESSAQGASARSADWSSQEQQAASGAAADIKFALIDANRAYEQKFGHIFIVCATSKSAVEILEILRCRMHNDLDTELLEAAEQQRQITQLRLKKWLGI